MLQYCVGDKLTVICANNNHDFAVDEVVYVVSVHGGNLIKCANVSGHSHFLEPTEVELVANEAEREPFTLFDLLAAQLLPAPLAWHFKRVGSILELFESMPHGYVLQCIQEVSLTPLERAVLGCLLAHYQEKVG